jgi:hypothetical protein
MAYAKPTSRESHAHTAGNVLPMATNWNQPIKSTKWTNKLYCTHTMKPHTMVSRKQQQAARSSQWNLPSIALSKKIQTPNHNT